MTPQNTDDRADATVWLPLLHILGGVAERVASRRSGRPVGTDSTAEAKPSAKDGEGE
jgi:hypothetical protein